MNKIQIVIAEAKKIIELPDDDIYKLQNVYEQLKLVKKDALKDEIINISLLQRNLEDLIHRINRDKKYKRIHDATIGMQACSYSSPSLLSYVRQCLYDFFARRGFQYFSTPDVDNEYYVFDSLNMEKNHPARQKNSTFYCKGFVLRPHMTSTRGFFEHKESSKRSIFSIGTVYRNDNDARHLPSFTQIDIAACCNSMSEMFYLLQLSVTHVGMKLRSFLKAFDVQSNNEVLSMRMRKHYFPYTCPSFELDVKCICDSQCSMCSHGWIEVAGCGILLSNILPSYLRQEMVMAFGMGIERLTSILCFMFLKKNNSIQSFYM